MESKHAGNVYLRTGEECEYSFQDAVFESTGSSIKLTYTSDQECKSNPAEKFKFIMKEQKERKLDLQGFVRLLQNVGYFDVKLKTPSPEDADDAENTDIPASRREHVEAVRQVLKKHATSPNASPVPGHRSWKFGYGS